MSHLKCWCRSHTEKSAIFGVLELSRSSFCQVRHLSMKKTILLYLSKSKLVNMTLMWKHGIMFQVKLKILCPKSWSLILNREWTVNRCLNTHGWTANWTHKRHYSQHHSIIFRNMFLFVETNHRNSNKLPQLMMENSEFSYVLFLFNMIIGENDIYTRENEVT